MDAEDEGTGLEKRLRATLSLIRSHQDTTQSETLKPDDPFEADERLLAVQWDWSGKGSHAEFTKTDELPFEKGRHLGHGLNGPVVRITCKGVKLALKSTHQRRPLRGNMIEEINVLEKLSHRHVVKLIGTYYQSHIWAS